MSSLREGHWTIARGRERDRKEARKKVQLARREKDNSAVLRINRNAGVGGCTAQPSTCPMKYPRRKVERPSKKKNTLFQAGKLLRWCDSATTSKGVACLCLEMALAETHQHARPAAWIQVAPRIPGSTLRLLARVLRNAETRALLEQCVSHEDGKACFEP